MSDHLTPDQFAKCFVNGAEGLELQHITECPAVQRRVGSIRERGGIVSQCGSGPDRRSCRVRCAGSHFISASASSDSGSEVSLGIDRGGSCSAGSDPGPDDREPARGRHR